MAEEKQDDGWFSKVARLLSGAGNAIGSGFDSGLEVLKAVTAGPTYHKRQEFQDFEKSVQRSGLPQIMLGAAPGTGEVLSAVEGISEAQRLRDAWNQGNYGQAVNAFGGTGLGLLGALIPGVGMLAGKGAKMANLVKLEKAQDLERAGKSADDIWKDTGWFKGPDTEWRFEIPDEQLKLTPKAEKLAGEKGFIAGRMGDLVEHPQLFSNYPQLAEQSIKFNVDQPWTGGSGTYSAIPKTTGFNLSVRSDLEKFPNIAAHELQHGVQTIEDFARGGGKASVAEPAYSRLVQNRVEQSLGDLAAAEASGKAAVEIYNPITGSYEAISATRIPETYHALSQYLATERKFAPRGITPREAYRRLGGEVEARAVEKRRLYTPRERAERIPSADYDVPMSEIAVRRKNDPLIQALMRLMRD